ncbi:MAG: DMT family transporter [Planctomycetes bacterium]|nr:DMT family transporter [Planctomycetota bacterium]
MASRALLLLILGAALIGLVPIGVRMCADQPYLIAPLAVAFWRFAFAVPPLLAWNRWRQRSVDAPARPWLLACAGLLFGCDIACFFVAITRTSVANATLLSNLAPLVVAAWSTVVERRPPTRGETGGALLAIAGVVLLVAPEARLEGGAHVVGIALALASAVFYGGYQIAVAHLRRDQPADRVMTVVAAVAALVLAPIALIGGGNLVPDHAGGWGLLIALAVLTQIGGQGLITWSLAHLAPIFSSVVLLVQPVVAIVLAWLLFDQHLGWMQGAGAVMVMLGIVLAHRGRSAT